MTNMLQAMLIVTVVVLLAHAPASAQEREPIDVASLGPQVALRRPG